MGIKGLFPYLQEVVPKAILDTELKRYTGRRLAIDASAWMYQFLSIVRTGSAAENLQNKEGQATSHLQGIVLRALKLLEVGVQPVFVFDGKPPDMKLAVNRARRQVRAAAAEEHAAAVASGTAPAEHVYKTASRSTVVTREHNQHAKDLLRTMGISVVQAPGEAEAACAQLCRAGKVYAAVTEDMDVLTFGSPRQIKNLFDVEGNRLRQGPRPAREINLGHVLEGLSQDAGSFIEFCILCGCDYLPHLPKIGPKTASQLLQREGSLSKVVRSIQSGKGPKGCTIPEDWDWKAAKKIFLEGPEELTDSELGREVLDLDAFRSLLVEKHQFNPSRVENMVERLRKVKEPGGPTQQKRLDTFFTVPSSPSPRKPPRGSKRSHADMIEADGSEQEPKANFLKPMEQICVEDTQEPEAQPAQAEEDSQAPTLAESSAPTVVDSPEGDGTLEDLWTCERCTFANDAQLPYCEMCDSPRKAEGENGKAAGAKPQASTPSAFQSLSGASQMIELDD